LTPELSESLIGGDPQNRHQALRLLEFAFAAVSGKDRVMLTLFEMEGWSISELAGLYRCSEGSVKVRLHRTRRKLRKRLARVLERSANLKTSTTTVNEARKCIAFKPGAE
jgi:DNA-directed RNA polymerase specialized sigma24 family protein